MHMSNYPHPMDDKVGFEATDEEIFGPSPIVRKCEQLTEGEIKRQQARLASRLVTDLVRCPACGELIFRARHIALQGRPELRSNPGEAT